MEYSVSQIHNLLRTYAHHFTFRPAQREEETHTTRSRTDQISISLQGRLLAEAGTQHGPSPAALQSAPAEGERRPRS